MADEQIRTLTQLLEDFAGGQEPNLKIRNLIVSLYDALPDGPVMANGQSVSIRTFVGADAHAGTAVVSGQTLTGVNLPANTIMLDNGDTGILVANNGLTASSDSATADLTSVPGTTIIKLKPSVALVANADQLSVRDATAVANGTAPASAVVAANGDVTRLDVLPIAPLSKIIKNNVKYPCPAPTGTYVDGITLTINASAQITAVVLS